MTTIHILYDLPNKRQNKIDVVCEHPKPDDREVVEALIKVLHADEIAPFGGPTDKIRGDKPDPVPDPVDVLARYGISNVMYSVDGKPMVTIYTVGK